MHILLTGASGFLGRHIAERIMRNDSFELVAAVRANIDLPVTQVCIPDGLDHDTDWSAALKGQDIVIHAAARAHIMNDESVDPLAEYRRVNVAGTLRFAQQAVEHGIKRFIFISSIKVNGEGTSFDRPYRVDDAPKPEDAYGVSKLEAESALLQLGSESGMEVVIVRPPLVYGPGVKGNFASMIRLVQKGIPLPFGAVHNKRSLVGVDNLVDLIVRCIDHPAAANQVFLAGDGEDVSTTELLRRVGLAMGKPTRLVPIPAGILQFGATLVGKKAMAQRLLGSLQVDISKTCEMLDWKPPYTVDEGLRRCFEKTD